MKDLYLQMQFDEEVHMEFRYLCYINKGWDPLLTILDISFRKISAPHDKIDRMEIMHIQKAYEVYGSNIVSEFNGNKVELYI